jgi:hypothetical protein
LLASDRLLGWLTVATLCACRPTGQAVTEINATATKIPGVASPQNFNQVRVVTDWRGAVCQLPGHCACRGCHACWSAG